ncbi:hypothetical protein GGR26_003223 [Lewinella marina]|uniref:LTD domain-containing protein n=1 Tax=Neolewinella marina TaxID=438751 RepID=A0A2G0CE45_9BACT|nr:CotH kinase family protein [Neolewinella marina]NJB87443.1 hypothetical protein [Neolewinella marina]PHK98248.1 hypothetical protein CGL56_11125 [Neolewinella marina]
MHLLLPILTALLCALSAPLRAQEGLVLEPTPGSYVTDQEVVIRGGDAGAVYYTTDGSRPTLQSSRYPGGPIHVGHSQVVRAAVFADGERRAEVGGSYLIDEPRSPLLTLSVGIDPGRLFHPRTGWFEAGDTPRRPNWDTHREHPVHVDLLEADGTPVFGGTVGFRLFGGTSRSHPQKSFSLSARKTYGKNKIEYPLFGPNGLDEFRFLVVRNGGSDWGRSYLRDALMTGLLQDPSWDLERQDSRPVRVFLNGRYWGVYHLREKINPRFLADHHRGVDKDSLSLLEHRLTAKHGSTTEYEQLLSYLERSDLSDPAAYAGLQELMDVDNFQRLQIAQTYFDNRDAGGNIRYWRPDGPDGRFRWILYDVDQGFGLHRDSGWTANTLELLTAPDGPVWPNPPWATLFQRKLLANPTYRRQFVNRTLDYLHTDFSAEAVTERLEAAIAAVEPEMPRHLRRWEQREHYWRYHLDQLRRFALFRPRYLREQFRDYFGGGADREVAITAGRGGYIVLNQNLHVGSDGLEGQYFSRFPISLEAVAEPGYHFAGWEGLADLSPSLDLSLAEDRPYRLKAKFVPARHAAADAVIINEVCPRHPQAGDWLEIHNRGDSLVDLSGWYLIDDSDRRFVLPDARLPAGGYLVICEDTAAFRAAYPGVTEVLGNLPYGLNKSEDRIGLYAHDNSYVNAISWQLPTTADTIFTYALALPGLDNGRHRNWVQEAGDGTPGGPNPEHLQAAIMTRQRFWLRVGIGLAVLLLVGVVRTWRPD